MWIVIASLISGVAGVAIAAILQGRRDLDEQFRTRMLEAADSYSTAVVAALIALNDVLQARTNVAVPETPLPTLRDALKAVDAAHLEHTRVELLFNDEGAANAAAGQALVEMRRACGVLRSQPDVDRRAAREAFERAHEAQDSFNRAARAEILAGSWSRSKLRVRAASWLVGAPRRRGAEPPPSSSA